MKQPALRPSRWAISLRSLVNLGLGRECLTQIFHKQLGRSHVPRSIFGLSMVYMACNWVSSPSEYVAPHLSATIDLEHIHNLLRVN